MNSEAVSTHRPSKAFSMAGTHLPICRMQSGGARGIAKRLQKRESSAQSSSPNLQELILLHPNNHPAPVAQEVSGLRGFCCFWWLLCVPRSHMRSEHFPLNHYTLHFAVVAHKNCFPRIQYDCVLCEPMNRETADVTSAPAQD